MIIFDLDGTLADCEHRRHFVDPSKNQFCTPHSIEQEIGGYWDRRTGNEFKPDWTAFYEACDLDKPIEPVISIWNDQIVLGDMGKHMIWSGRSESVRNKTEKWLEKHLLCFESHQLKMRPIGNTEPDEVLKERWLEEAIEEDRCIDFVFESHAESIKMWKRHRIFVFNCAQHDKEF